MVASYFLGRVPLNFISVPANGLSACGQHGRGKHPVACLQGS
jgi:hypothetical protein